LARYSAHILSRIRYLYIVSELADPIEFRRAYERHRGTMVTVAWRVLHDQAAAEDVVQDVFTQLWRNPDAYDAKRAGLSTYLTTIVRNRALDRWRTRVVAGAATARMAAEAATERSHDNSAAAQVIRAETARAVRRAIDKIPGRQREAILLAYGSGLTANEVADLTGAPLGTTKGRLRLGLRAAAKQLTAEGAY
jgi:RNA polymerase sigma-70 factor (ECF subfamily)